MPSRLLQILVFISGMSVMAAEMTGLRLLAPFFGTSLVVTTVLIGSMMTFLALGYWLGGRWSDRKPEFRTLSRVTAGASVLILLIPVLGQPVLRTSAAAIRPLLQGEEVSEPTVAVAMLIGGFLATLGLFALPVVLMGTVSPWAIRLAVTDVQTAGKVSGRLYALSTLGSIIGSFLPALLLIPLLGVRNTFFAIGTVLMAASAPGLLRGARAALPPAGMAALMLLPPGTVRPMDGLIWEGESLYHFIQVVEQPLNDCPNARYLYLNEGVGVHSIKCPDPDPDREARGYWSYMAAVPYYFEEPEDFDRALIIGLAGGTIGRKLLANFPDIEIDGVELDGTVVKVGETWFDNADPRIHPIVMDGRTFLQVSDQQYDLVLVDAYRQPYIPFHLTTHEFFELIANHLTEDGLVAVNVATLYGETQDLEAMIYRTMAETFPTVLRIDASASNDILVGARKPKDIELYAAQIQTLPNARLSRIRDGIQDKVHAEVEGWETARLLTDDRAPVEMAWDEMLWEFAR